MTPDNGPTNRPNKVPVQVGLWHSPKIRPWHLDRLAIVYVRQSSPQQVAENRESTLRQYALVDRAVELGWPADRVIVIDDDQAKSGATVEGRLGFQRLLAEVGLDHVGLILGIEMSRLARSCKDWHQLIELCAVFRTLLTDPDGVYDPTDYNDRLLLGLTGIMSEAELHVLRNRMRRGCSTTLLSRNIRIDDSQLYAFLDLLVITCYRVATLIFIVFVHCVTTRPLWPWMEAQPWIPHCNSLTNVSTMCLCSWALGAIAPMPEISADF